MLDESVFSRSSSQSATKACGLRSLDLPVGGAVLKHSPNQGLDAVGWPALRRSIGRLCECRAPSHCASSAARVSLSPN